MTYKPALLPRDHQKRALRKMRDEKAFALLMEMGTGKSKVICDEYGAREDANDISDLLLFAPAGCYRNWAMDRDDEPSELQKQLDRALYKRARIATWISGANVLQKQSIELLLAERKRPRIFVVNVEAISSVNRAINACEEFINSSRRGVMCVVDESPTIKGKDANRTKAIIQLGALKNVAYRRILTGLVTPNSPLDLFSQFEFLDWRILGFRSFLGFRARHAIMRPMITKRKDEDGFERERKFNVVVGFRNVKELNGKIDPYSFRVLKEECLDLPKKQYLPSREIELTSEQARIYQELKDNATARLSGESYVTVDMVLTERLRLSQVLCGYTVDEAGLEHEIPSNRTKELMNVLGDYHGKATIWTNHRFCVNKIVQQITDLFGPRSVAEFHGGNAKTRHQDEARYKGDPDCRFMVATPAAGGRGNNWFHAGLSIYHDNSDNLDHRMQSEDRSHREGLMGPTGAGFAWYLDIIAPNTIDVKRLQLLRRKINLAAVIHGDDFREWLI